LWESYTTSFLRIIGAGVGTGWFVFPPGGALIISSALLSWVPAIIVSLSLNNVIDPSSNNALFP